MVQRPGALPGLEELSFAVAMTMPLMEYLPSVCATDHAGKPLVQNFVVTSSSQRFSGPSLLK